MVIPELKSLFSPDIERPALPPDVENCSVFLQAGIGAKGSEGEEIFSFSVVTPSFLLATEALPRWGRGLLVVDSFSWQTVERSIQRLLAHAHRASWSEVAQVLNNELEWEFDNYQA